MDSGQLLTAIARNKGFYIVKAKDFNIDNVIIALSTLAKKKDSLFTLFDNFRRAASIDSVQRIGFVLDQRGNPYITQFIRTFNQLLIDIGEIENSLNRNEQGQSAIEHVRNASDCIKKLQNLFDRREIEVARFSFVYAYSELRKLFTSLNRAVETLNM